MAGEKVRIAKNTLASADFGDRIKEELKTLQSNWEVEICNCKESIRDLEVEYYTEIVKTMQG